MSVTSRVFPRLRKRSGGAHRGRVCVGVHCTWFIIFVYVDIALSLVPNYLSGVEERRAIFLRVAAAWTRNP